MRFKTLLYAKDKKNPRVARITFNRPEKYNAITDKTSTELREAVGLANADDAVHVIVLQGKGDAFCAGYDIGLYGEAEGDHPCKQEKTPWEPMRDYAEMKRITDDFMSLWRSYKPVIARVQKYAIAGGSDIALCCDQIIMDENARIGYMPTRVWGCPTTAWWVYRLGIDRAKRMLLTGDLIDARTAVSWGLVSAAVPLFDLDAAVDEVAARMAAVPRAQLMMQKLMINQAFENMGLANTQMIATLFDGVTRHSPEGLWFRRHSQLHGFKDAVRWRDSGDSIPEGDEARALIADIEAKLSGNKKRAPRRVRSSQ